MRYPLGISLIAERLARMGGLGGLVTPFLNSQENFLIQVGGKETPVTPQPGLSPCPLGHYGAKSNPPLTPPTIMNGPTR